MTPPPGYALHPCALTLPTRWQVRAGMSLSVCDDKQVVAICLVAGPLHKFAHVLHLLLADQSTVCGSSSTGCVMVWGQTLSIQDELNRVAPGLAACAICSGAIDVASAGSAAAADPATCAACAGPLLAEVRLRLLHNTPLPWPPPTRIW